MRVLRPVRGGRGEKLELTPMIDVVFLLLIFFIMSLRIVAAEGDFQVKMPTGSAEAEESEELDVFVRLTADEQGDLAGISVNQRPLAGKQPMAALHAEIVRILGPRPDQEERDRFSAVLQVDPRLNYRHVIQAITAISGYLDEQGNRVPLIETIRFAAPAKKGQK